MDNPTEEITQVVHTLCQGTPDQQTEAINTYFTPNASFTHPFCRTGSFDGSRNLIHAIYKWYKLLSPKIELNVNSIGKIHPSTLPSINPHNSKLTSLPTTAYDSHNLILYLNITQILSFWMIPFHHANVTLTTELHLTRPPNSRKFYIKAQNDLYQNDQLIRFFMPFGLGELSMHMWQYSSTMMCVFGAFLLAPATRLQQSWLEQQGERNGGGGGGRGGSASRAENEMRSLVSSAMEGVGHKRPEGRRRQSSNVGAASGDRGPSDGADAGASSSAGASGNASTGASTGASSSNGGVQQFGNMQVIT
jgi:hypothetical protein